MALTAIVLAGGPRDSTAALSPDAPNKAFVHVGGAALVTRTLRALRRSAAVGRIIVVAPRESFTHPALADADERRADGRRISDSLISGLAGLPPDEDLLISASDLPVLSPAAVDEFVVLAAASRADLAYACVEKRVHEARFPQIPHTWARLRGGTYCGGGLIALKPRVLSSLLRFLERLGAARKNPLHLAALFGWDVVLRYVVRRLSIEGAEARASQLLGYRVRGIVCSHPEIAVNVDRPGDVALAEELLASASD